MIFQRRVITGMMLVQALAFMGHGQNLLPTQCPGYKGLAYFGWAFAYPSIRNDAANSLCMVLDDDRGRTGRNIPAVLGNFSQSTGHPEMAFGGAVNSGCSIGGMESSSNAAAFPSRMIALIPNDGFIYSDSLLTLPALISTSDKDNLAGNSSQLAGFHRGRAQDAPWCYMIRSDNGHCNHDEQSVRFQFEWLAAISKLRIPDYANSIQSPVAYGKIAIGKGWLGDMTLAPNGYRDRAGRQNNSVAAAAVSAYADFKGDKSKAVWLPDERIARLWLALMTRKSKVATGPAVTITKPSALTRYTMAGQVKSVPIAISATAAPTAAGLSIKYVTFLAQGISNVTIGTDSTAPYEITWDLQRFLSSEPDGMESFNLMAAALQVDSEGNAQGLGTSDWVPIRIIQSPTSISAVPYRVSARSRPGVSNRRYRADGKRPAMEAGTVQAVIRDGRKNP